MSPSTASPPSRPPDNTRLFWLLAAAIVGVCLLLFGLGEPRTRDRGPGSAAVGVKVEHLALTPLTGAAAPKTASDLQGKVTLLNYWGPWCPPCQIEFPHLAELEQHFRDNGDFQFLSVSCSGSPGDDANMEATTAAFMAERQADFPTYRDPDMRSRMHLVEVAKLQGFAYPTTAILDRNGIVRALWLGYQRGDETAMREVLDDELRKK